MYDEKLHKLDSWVAWKAAKASIMGPPTSPRPPKMGTLQARFRNRIPSQMRRALPLYILCLAVFFFILYADALGAGKAAPIILASTYLRPQSGRYSSYNSAFPKKMWQSWKTDPFNFAKRDRDTARSWTVKNPGYRYEVLTDTNDMAYVEEHYGPNGFNRPDIIDMYRNINLTIIKADMLRYMIMYAEGGVWADIDVEALKPVDRFVPARYKASDIDMVIGVEIDQPEFRDHPILGKKSMSFCQWTFMCKPQLPVMMQLIENIMAWLTAVAAQQAVPIPDIQLDFDEVILGTGPSAFTAAVLSSMNDAPHAGGPITWTWFHGMDESRVVDRVLVLTVEAFAAGQGHSDSGNHDARGALVKHHYHASNWPSKHPRYSHPAYAEVERCNWDAACVRRWDADVEAYETLSPEEQRRKVEEREAEVRRQVEEARRVQEKTVQLEMFAQAVKKAGEESRREMEVEERRKTVQQAAAPGDGGDSPFLAQHKKQQQQRQNQDQEGLPQGPPPANPVFPPNRQRMFGMDQGQAGEPAPRVFGDA